MLQEMPPKKLAGIGVAMAGIIWYSQIKMAQAGQGAQQPEPPNADLKAMEDTPLLKPAASPGSPIRGDAQQV